jgi:hypothetical protein
MNDTNAPASHRRVLASGFHEVCRVGCAADSIVRQAIRFVTDLLNDDDPAVCAALVTSLSSTFDVLRGGKQSARGGRGAARTTAGQIKASAAAPLFTTETVSVACTHMRAHTRTRARAHTHTHTTHTHTHTHTVAHKPPPLADHHTTSSATTLIVRSRNRCAQSCVATRLFQLRPTGVRRATFLTLFGVRPHTPAQGIFSRVCRDSFKRFWNRTWLHGLCRWLQSRRCVLCVSFSPSLPPIPPPPPTHTHAPHTHIQLPPLLLPVLLLPLLSLVYALFGNTAAILQYSRITLRHNNSTQHHNLTTGGEALPTCRAA